MLRKSRIVLVLAIVVWAVLPPLASFTKEPAARPANWATKVELPGLPNLYKINENLYRGAQPTAEGFKELEKLGIKTIINLRSDHSDKEAIAGTKLDLVEMPMIAIDVREKHVVEFLRVAADPKRQPVFFHCQHGADRTGTMGAAYRVVIEGWPKRQAIDEMTKGGYFFHAIFINLPRLIDSLDVEKIKKELAKEKP